MNAEEKPKSKTPVVLAYDRTHPRDLSLVWLAEKGIEVREGLAQTDPNFHHYSEDQIIAAAQGVDAVLGLGSAKFTRRVLDALPQLRFISKVGIGTDSIDIDAATERGILVCNTPEEGGTIAVAEHAIALMLALSKQLSAWTPDYFQKGGWRGVERFSIGISGATVGIIGFGRIGRAVAERLTGWNARIIAYDPYVTADINGVKMVELPTLLAESDFVTIHCGATEDNLHLIGADAIATMKPGAFLINTGRGSLVDEVALKKNLKSGHLGGAGLDVFEQEPPDSNDELFTLQNVIVTPHVAARTIEVFLDRHLRAARNLWAMISGEGHADLVNPNARALAGREKFAGPNFQRTERDV